MDTNFKLGENVYNGSVASPGFGARSGRKLKENSVTQKSKIYYYEIRANTSCIACRQPAA